jgi:hypothetical protein
MLMNCISQFAKTRDIFITVNTKPWNIAINERAGCGDNQSHTSFGQRFVKGYISVIHMTAVCFGIVEQMCTVLHHPVSGAHLSNVGGLHEFLESCMNGHKTISCSMLLSRTSPD